MKKLNYYLFYFLLFAGSIFLFQSCNDDSVPELSNNNADNYKSVSEELPTINSFDLMMMKSHLENEGVDIPEVEIENGNDSIQARGIILNNPLVRAIKISSKTKHPDRSGRLIDVSGVLLVPKKTLLTSLSTYRIIIAPPPTYTYNQLAPSNAFKRISLLTGDKDLNFLYFWTLQAQTGFVVFIPDYPGYGDSYGQCFHPYLDSKALVTSTIDLMKSVQNTLSANGYRYKKEVMVTGYSQGGFVAASLARELETNPLHGFTVRLLVTGGTPCNLKQIADIVRHSDKVVHTFFLPFGLWGYKLNAYPQINVNDFLQEPYASQSLQYYDGTYKDINDKFPKEVKQLYTESFLKYLDVDPNLDYINKILVENSVQPWRNKCKFVMTHGISDVSVYYQNAKDFSYNQNRIGGNVDFIPTLGDHIEGVIPYYAKASFYLGLYK